MSFSDPTSVVIGGVTYSLPRTSSGPNSGTFQSSDGLYKLEISHAYGKRVRRLIRLTETRQTQSFTNSQLSFPASMSASLVLDEPIYGFTASEKVPFVLGLMAMLEANSGSKVTQFVGGEN